MVQDKESDFKEFINSLGSQALATVRESKGAIQTTSVVKGEC